MAKASAAPYVTKTDIEEFLSLESERLRLGREAEALKAKAEPLKKKLLDYVRAEGGKGLSCLRSGFVLAIKLAKGSVAWKDAFVRVAGVEEAEKVAALVPPREVLSVEKAA